MSPVLAAFVSFPIFVEVYVLALGLRRTVMVPVIFTTAGPIMPTSSRYSSSFALRTSLVLVLCPHPSCRVSDLDDWVCRSYATSAFRACTSAVILCRTAIV